MRTTTGCASSSYVVMVDPSELPKLSLPDWLHHWVLRPFAIPRPSPKVLVVAFGLIRSLEMLETTMASLERFAPATNATLVIRAVAPKNL